MCVGGDFVTVRAHSVAFLLLTAAFACACGCFVRRRASWIRARRWWWASGVTSGRECCRPASVLWGSVEGSGWGSWSVWVVIIVTLRAHSDVFLLLTAAFACACVCFVRWPASWVRARRWWWASGVTSGRECCRPASVLWGSVEGSGWGSWSVWVVIIVTLRAHSDVFLLLTAAFACACVCFVRWPASWVRARRWWWASGVTSGRECYRPASVL